MTSGGGVGGAGQVDILFIDIRARLDLFEQQMRQLQAQAGQQGGTAGQSAGTSFSSRLSGAASTGFKAFAGLAVGAGVAVGAALVGALTTATNLAYEQANAVRSLQAEFGLTAAEAKNLGDVATQVFGDNFAGSLTEAAEAVASVKKNMKDLADTDLKSVTEGALAISDTFKVDVNDSTAAANTLMKQFGLTGQQALDFITKGFQKGLPDDFLDSITEYSTQFKNGGADAGQFFSILETGAANGALGTDKAADAFKEFRVRIQDGSKTTSAGLAQLGIDSKKLAADMASGQVTAADAFGLVLGKLKGTKDATVQMQAGVALLGTQYEDLGQASVNALSLTATKTSDLNGATAALNVKYDSLGALAGGVWRQIQVALIPVGKEVLHLANDALPYVKEGIRAIMPVLTNLVSGMVSGFNQGRQVVGRFLPYIQDALTFIRPLVQALGPLFSSAFQLVLVAYNQFLKPAIAFIAPLFRGAFQIVTATLTYAVQLITGIIKTITALFNGDLKGAVSALGGIFEAGVTAAVRVFKGFASIIYNIIAGIAPNMAKAAHEIIMGLVNGVQNGVGQVKQAAENLAANVLGPIKDFLGIRSPSTEMHDVGVNVGEGLILGMVATQGDVAATGEALGSALAAGVEAGTAGLANGFGAKVGASLIGGLGALPPVLNKVSKEMSASAQATRDARAELEKTIGFDKWTSGLSKMSAAQLAHASALARSSGNAEQYNAIQGEMKSRQDAVNSAVEKRTELEKSIHYDAWAAGLKNATGAQLEHAAAVARTTGDSQRYATIQGVIKERQDAVNASLEKRKELEASIKTDAWTKSLVNNSTAQLLHAQAIARAAGNTERYSALTAELTRRSDEAAAATQRSKDALKAAADQLASNRKAISDQQTENAYVEGLKTYSDLQLEVARRNAERAGDQTRFNAVLSQQTANLQEAAAAADALYEALSTAAGVRFTNTANAADAGFRQSFGVGDEGLIRALATTTGLTVAKVREDVEGAIADAKKYAPEAVAVIERVYDEALAHRRDVAAQSVTIAQEGAAAEAAAYKNELARMLATIPTASDEGLVKLYTLAGATRDRELADAVFQEMERRSRSLNDSLNEMYAASSVASAEGFARDARAAGEDADDAAISVEFLNRLVRETLAAGGDPANSTFIGYLDEIIERGGQAAAAAALVKQQILAVSDADPLPKRGATPTTPGIVAGLGTRQPERLGPVADPDQIRLANIKAEYAAQEELRKSQEAFQKNLDSMDFAKWTAGLKDMSDGQLAEALALARTNLDVERFNALSAEIATRGPLTATVKIVGIDTGIKALDLYKSALQGIGDVISKTFADLVSGTEVTVGSVLKSVALMALGIIKSVATAILAYEAQAIAIALIESAVTFNFVRAGIALAAAAVIVGIATGLESRLSAKADGISSSAGAISSGSGAALGGDTATGSSNNVLDIPNASVSIQATPEFVGLMGREITRFGGYIERLVTEGILVRSEVQVAPTSGDTLAWELNKAR